MGIEKGSFVYRLGAFDQFVNSLIGKGSRDQTFSARCYEGRTYGVKWCIIAEKILNFMFFWEPHHCEVSFFTDPTEWTYGNKDGDGVRNKQD